LGSVEFPFVDIPPLFLPEPTEAEKARVRALLAEERLGALTRDVNARLSAAEADPQARPGAPALVVLHVGAGNRFRDWGADNLAALASLLIREGKARVALIGTEGDRAVEERIRAASPAGTLPFSGRLNLMETRELIRLAALFAGPDSGPMHIAASTPTPIVAWFGPTLPANFAPWRPDRGRTVILERMLPCRPCEQRACVTDDFRCLQELSPSEVFEACRPFLL
jgi:heptosyltransferase-1